MNPKVDPRLVDVPVRTVKAELKRGEGVFQKLNRDAGDVLEQARGTVQLQPKVMADTMGISHSLVCRGLKSEDDLGFHRLWQLSDAFWWELVLAIVAKRQLAKRTTTLERIA